MSSLEITRIGRHQYIHVLDRNLNITRVELGPANFIQEESEKIVRNPTNMVKIPPQHYCVVLNPVVKDKDGNIVMTDFNEVKIKFGEIELRTYEDNPEPFPLYPYERI